MAIDLNGTIGGIPKKVAIPLGVVGLAGGYIFFKRYSASKAASNASSAATSTGSLAGSPTGATGTTPYGPYGGDNEVNLQTSNSGFGQGQYAALGATANGVVAQNQAIMTALATSVDQEVTTNKALASLLAVNPGALAQYKKLPPNSVYEQAMQANMSTAVNSVFPGPGGISGGVSS